MSALAPTSQLLLRHADALRDRDLLLINPPVDTLARELARIGAGGVIFDQRRSAHLARQAQAVGPFENDFGALYDAARHAESVLFLPREKARLKLLLEMAAAATNPGGRVWLVGENRAGARSAGRHLDAIAGHWQKVDAARRCSLYAAASLSDIASPRLEDLAVRWQLTLAGEALTLVSLPGVFSHGELDPATRMLIDHLPELAGEVLDFGCGCGVIGLAASRQPQVGALTFVDDDALALEATRMSLRANGLEARSIEPVAGIAEVTGRFDAILSNPPFHQGVATDYVVAEALVDQAPDRLCSGGQLVLVANAFLDYGQRIERRFGQCEILGSDRRFRVYRASRNGRPLTRIKAP